MLIRISLFFLALIFLGTTVSAQTLLTTIPTGGKYPFEVKANWRTNKIYITDLDNNNVTVINADTNSVEAVIPTGEYPRRMAINTVTNKVYILNGRSFDVTVIDGASNTAMTLPIFNTGDGVVVNERTNKIYISSYVNKSVIVLDGTTNDTVTIPIQIPSGGPDKLVVNPVKNKIYVDIVNNDISGNGNDQIFVIDGNTNQITGTVPVGNQIRGLGVNTVTNKIYVANRKESTVSVIDGETDTKIRTLNTGFNPGNLVIDEATNKIYTANYNGGDISVIDGATSAVETLLVGRNPIDLGVDPTLNKIYVSTLNENNAIIAIRGGSYTAKRFPRDTKPASLVVNPATHRVYVADVTVGGVVVLQDAPDPSTQLTLSAEQSSAVAGRSVTLLAEVAGQSPVGTVTFSESGRSLCTAQPLRLLPGSAFKAVATCTVPNLAAGNHDLTATYSGDDNNASSQATLSLPVAASGPIDYSDLWWGGAAENGWGLSVTQHGAVQFNVLYAYSQTGDPAWYVMPGGSWNSDFTQYTGPIYRPIGPPLDGYFYYTSDFAAGNPVGSLTLTFIDANTATLDYSINGMVGRKNITRQPFGVADSSPALKVRDLWWNASYNGTGVAIAQQQRTLFATWFNYGFKVSENSNNIWYVMPGCNWVGSVCTGDLYVTSGPAWAGVPYNVSLFNVGKVGSMSFNFIDANHATMSFTVEGISGVRHLTRQPF